MAAKESQSNHQTVELQNNDWLIKENKELKELIEKLRNDLEVSQKISSEPKSNDMSRIEAELENVRKEQEDLLVLLTDQDSKLRHYKKRLKDLGQTVISSKLIVVM